ncbi:MAG: sigma-54 dependent transcriptional regulator [Crocinitomicaceae bacterium]
MTILVVDDSSDMQELIKRQLEAKGYYVLSVCSVVEAISFLEEGNIDVLITDLNMPEIHGEQLVRYSAEHFPELPVLVITGYPEVDTAVNVMKFGAFEYLIKPFSEDDLLDSIEKIIVIKGENVFQEINTEGFEDYYGIIGSSTKMRHLFAIIDRAKDTSATILISGESGTGKELVARAVHYSGKTSSKPFVSVNCGAIPDQLIESELFGHVKGSFTGAISNKVGFFEAANGGTLFLDEISNTTLELQAKLLRAIQEKEITPVGSIKNVKIDVRIIAATNIDVKKMVEQGKFREDLFYRLNVISIDIPPLRDRNNDLNRLIEYFVGKYSKEYGKKRLSFARGVLQILEKYTWPGNVRELENFIQRLIIMTDGKIQIRQIPDYMKEKISNKSELELLSLREVEKIHIQKILTYTNNNKSEAAKILGIDRKTLRERLK